MLPALQTPFVPPLRCLALLLAFLGGCAGPIEPPGDGGAGVLEPQAFSTPKGGTHLYAGLASASRGFIFLPGSNGEAAVYREIVREVGSLDDVLALSLDYCNASSVGTICSNYCARTADGPARCTCLDQCYAAVREFRTAGPAAAPVPQAAAACDQGEDVGSRLVAALQALGATQLLRCTTNGCAPAWDRLVLAGSSQGAGMAAYLAVTHRVRRVNQYAGTVDTVACAGQPSRPASWVLGVPTGATPPADFFGLHHAGDTWAANIAAVWTEMALPAPMHRYDGPLDAWGNQNRTGELATCCPGGKPTQECQHGCPSKNPIFKELWQDISGLR